MTAVPARHLFDPGDGRLLAAACALLCVVVVGPAFWSAHYAPLFAAALLTAGAMLFSVRRSLVVLLVATAVIPGPVLALLRIPLGFKLTEVLLIATLLFLAIDVVWARRLRVTTTAVDGLVAAFLAVALLSALLGAYYGNDDKGSILRNLRYPLYYAAFFAATQAFSPRDGARLIAPVLMVIGPVVGATYIFEFLGAIDLSAGERFFRVARPQGVVLPVAMLLTANLFIHDPRRFGRLLPALAFIPTGLAFALTMGRGMWLAFAAGLATTLWLRHRSRPRGARRAWGAAILAAAVIGVLLASVLVFQRFTGAAVSAHALERSRTFVDFSRDVQVLGRLMGYSEVLGEIAERPVFGSGQGRILKFYGFDPEEGRFETWEAWTVDSLFLTLWLKMGLPGLIVFSLLYLRLLRIARSRFHPGAAPDQRAFAAGAFSALVAMGVFGIADGSMINGRFAVLFAVLFAAVARSAADPAPAPGPAHAAS